MSMTESDLPTRPKPIRRRTPKRAAEEARYRRRVKEWLKDKIVCRGHNCIYWPTQCHHSHGRRGRLLLYEPFWIPVCEFCGAWIHENPKQARELGLLCPQGCWNDQSLVPR